MRKTFVLLGLLALALPLAGVAGVNAGEGTLSVEDGQGKLTLQARGGVIGRIDRGSIVIYDLTPEDAYDPYVTGDDQPIRFVGENGIRYGGLGVRFRLVGGRYRIVIDGRGIDLSVVAKGTGSIVAARWHARSRRVLARRGRLPQRPRELQAAPGDSQAFPARWQRARREGPRQRRRRLMTAGAQTILVVEDEASIASFVSLYLKNAGYDVRAVTTGSAALTHVADEAPALIILDLMLPDIDGIEICRRVRKTSDVPILMLTARDEDVDKIIGLEVGADDYLTKPFNPRELVARVKSVLRRAAPERRRDVEEELHHGDLVDQRRPPRGEGRRGRDPARTEGVRPALGAARPQGARPHARPAARARLGLHVRRRHAHRRRARAAVAPQARRGVADRDRVGCRLQGRPRPRTGARRLR